MLRLAVKDFMFSDGTMIPAGTRVAMAAYSVNRSEVTAATKHYGPYLLTVLVQGIYSEPHTFQASRFSDKGE